MNVIDIYTDGGARGNPGEAAIGVYMEDENKNKIVSFGEKIGFSTNNVAEYKAVIKALAWLLKNKEIAKGGKKINLFLDSQLIYSQITGLYKVKDSKLRKLLFEVRQKEAELETSIHYFNIRREENSRADTMVNMALDNKL